MILIGELSLWVALLMATWAATVSFAGGALGRRDLVASGERAIYATLAMVVLASLGLWTAIFTHDFSFKYVASFTSANLPKAYLLTSFWAGQAGSLLFWCLILSIYSALALWTNRTRNRALMPYVSGTLAIVLIFFLATMCLGANPYERLDWIPPDGRGMNPQLQNPGMAIHPPNLYLGYVGTTIPFAFAIAALITRRLDAEWLAAVRKWALLAWFFKFHDPTQMNRQGPDVGDSYRSAIFASDQAQLKEAEKFIAEQQATDRFKGRKVVTQLVAADKAGPFYAAEDYHQDYHAKHGGTCPLPPE